MAEVGEPHRVMEKTYVIAWRSKTEPRFGQGKKLFTRDEAESLADEMNQDYPAFIHEPFNLADETVSVVEPVLINVDFMSAPAEAPQEALVV